VIWKQSYFNKVQRQVQRSSLFRQGAHNDSLKFKSGLF